MSGSSTATVAEIVRLYRDEKLSMRAVADKTGATFDEVRGAVRRQKIARSRGRYPAVSDAEAAVIAQACTSGGLTSTDAGKQFARHRATICAVLRRRGLVPEPDADHLRARDAAAVAGITVRELGRQARRGVIGSVRATVHGRRLYVRADLEAFRARREGWRQ